MSFNRITSPINLWFENKYGSKRGFLKTYWYQFNCMLGRYNHYQQVDWSKIKRLVFVCKGNVCRSAFAEQVAKSLDIESISCGIRAIENAHANEQAVLAARKMGYNLSQHKTTPLMYPVLTSSDLIIAMEPEQVEFMEEHAAVKLNYTLLGLWGNATMPYLHDPFNCTPEYFGRCFKIIEDAVSELKLKIIHQ